MLRPTLVVHHLTVLAVASATSAGDRKEEEWGYHDRRPYFPGLHGEVCRWDRLDAWKAASASAPPTVHDGARPNNFVGAPGITKEALDAVMATELYYDARESCQAEIQMYNRAAAVVCLLESEADYELSYSDFWNGDAFYYDGEYDLATMFAYTSNFTEVPNAPCFADCYLGPDRGGDSCAGPASQGWMTNYGKISTEQYCALQWGRIDVAYFALRLCAVEAIGNPAPSGLDRAEFVGRHQAMAAENAICKYKHCEAGVYESIVDSIDDADAPSASAVEHATEARVGLRR